MIADQLQKIAFTIVLNGMPFLLHQATRIPFIFDKWIIIEGVTENTHCTSWCRPIPDTYHTKDYLSIDGTTKLIDDIQEDHPDKVIVVRKEGKKWNGKTEMVNSVFSYITQPTLLFQIDVDEFWEDKTLSSIFSQCEHYHLGNEESQFALQYACRYFVGRNLVCLPQIDLNSNQILPSYGNMNWDWIRTWKVNPNQAYFETHEPPKVIDRLTQQPVSIYPKENTYKAGWSFDHYAYVLPDQVLFKEDFYGYKNAVKQWMQLQVAAQNLKGKIRINDYLKWVEIPTYAEKIDIEKTSEKH